MFPGPIGFGLWIPEKDEEIAVVAHNDPHAGNMMMDRNDTTGQSLILIDWDLCQYGYRVFDLAYYMFYGSFVHVAPFIGNEDFDYDDPGQGSPKFGPFIGSNITIWRDRGALLRLHYRL